MMNEIFNPIVFHSVEYVMIALAFMVFFGLRFITPGYGMFYSSKWGPSICNRLGWVLMEAPVFIAMAIIWWLSPRREQLVPAIMAVFFLIHYFQRSFIFPMLIKGNSRMPLCIMLMGICFNLVNAYLIGGWLFYVCPDNLYSDNWLASPCFLCGTAIFFLGMGINLHSDHIIRHLRKPGDHNHYIPYGGMFKYVTSANYFGELTEWVGYAILSWSMPGVVFALWTFANLGPRARSLHHRYVEEFGETFINLKRKYIIPFIW